jgi:hypothetical protein
MAHDRRSSSISARNRHEALANLRQAPKQQAASVLLIISFENGKMRRTWLRGDAARQYFSE